MASITYGATTALANISRLDTLADGNALAFGEIVSAGELTNIITIKVAINGNASDGSYNLYLVESHDGVVWTDDIDPTDDSTDVKPKLHDAQLLASASTIFVTTTRAFVEFSVSIPMLVHAKYIGFVLDNDSGFTVGAGSSTGNQQTLTYA